MRFITSNSELVIELTGREPIWALKSKLVIAKKDILQAVFMHSFNDWRKLELRLPGAGVPGKLVAGSFWTEEGWDFLYLTNPHGWMNPIAHNVLYIETKLPKYKRIVLSCSQSEALRIMNWATAT